MDARTLEQLKSHLEADLVRLEAEVALIDAADDLAEKSGENAFRAHMADQGSATLERELDMTLEDNLRRALADVRSTLKRIEEGTYGLCLYCQEEIPSERLEAVPTATLCVACKTADESR